MTQSSRWKYVLLLSASMAVHAAAMAQETAEEPASQDTSRALPTVTVTAQRTEESLQSVPIAITAVGGEQMQDMGITNVDDLALQSPGVNIKSDFGAANPNIFIRGVPTHRHHVPPSALSQCNRLADYLRGVGSMGNKPTP